MNKKNDKDLKKEKNNDKKVNNPNVLSNLERARLLFVNIKNDASQNTRNNSNKVTNSYNNRSENKNKDIRSNINNYKEEKKIINETKKYETTHKYWKNTNSSSNYITWNAKTENKYKININANKEDKKSMNSIYNNKDKDKDKKNSDDPLIKNSIRYKYKRKNMD